MPDTYLTSRLGIAAVQSRAAQLRQIWRETPTGDVGIDGHLEMVRDDGTATAIIVGVQVKSGTSYLRPANEGFRYPTSSKERHYWEQYAVPVLLVLHDPETERSYWLDVRQEFRAGRKPQQSVVVPEKQVLQTSTVAQLFANATAALFEYIEDVPQILNDMLHARAPNPTFDVSFFDLFCHGLTNLARSLYFGIDLAMTAAEQKVVEADEPSVVRIGPNEYNFIERYIRFLVSQDLVHANYSDIRIDLVSNDMIPVFLVPLSRRGRQLRDLISSVEHQMIANGSLSNVGTYAVQESYVEISEQQVISKVARVTQIKTAMSPSNRRSATNPVCKSGDTS